MFLVIDNSEEHPSTRSAVAARCGASKIIFYFWLNNKCVQRIFKSSHHTSIGACLEKFLISRKLSLKNIKCLGVVMGAGRFTATRLAVTFANTLAFCLKIPVIGLTENFLANPPDFWLKKAKIAKAGKYVIASYSGEARIG